MSETLLSNLEVLSGLLCGFSILLYFALAILIFLLYFKLCKVFNKPKVADDKKRKDCDLDDFAKIYDDVYTLRYTVDYRTGCLDEKLDLLSEQLNFLRNDLNKKKKK